MLKGVKADLEELCAAVDHIEATLPRMILAEKVDLAARLSSTRKTLEELDVLIKDEIKKKLKHAEGTVSGESFQAVLTPIPVTRLDSKALKEHEPGTWEAYAKRTIDERINFKPRG